ncbi:alkaline phosphatase family protein [Nocardia vaccinii]|uniref:alkaline phosphatase family protein n=1 Tax=Nocardia vaccinii TaxID=1822 RepID=UPI0008298A19|nr:alkaline phosphatase family protein [Nocardia vaccinii]
MKKPQIQRAFAIAASVAAMILSSAVAGAEPGRGDAPDHIFYIMMENHGYSQVIGNTADAPYINSLTTRANVETAFHGVTHPSLPNYLAAFSGDFQGIWDDCAAGANITCAPEEFVPTSGDASASASLTPDQIAGATAKRHMFNGRNLVDQLETAGKSWKAYMQSMPTAGFTGAKDPKSLYAVKHNPFMYFSDIANNPARTNKVVPQEGNLDQDLSTGNVAQFTWISPDVCHDMHGASTAIATGAGISNCAYPASSLDHSVITLGDQYLKDTIGKITSSPIWSKGNNSIIIAWDENDYAGYSGGPGSPVGAKGAVLGGGDAPMLVLNNKGKQGHKINTRADHYTTLATIEKLWKLGCLANTCSPTTSGSIEEMFHE